MTAAFKRGLICGCGLSLLLWMILLASSGALLKFGGSSFLHAQRPTAADRSP